MKTSLLLIAAILGVASYTMLPTGVAPSEDETKLPGFAQEAVQAVAPDTTRSPDEFRMPSSIGEVVFPHLEHIDDFGIECQECHHEVKATVLHTPHDDYFKDFWIKCNICHRPGEAPREGAIPCSDCHHKRPAGIADQTLSSKVVIHKKCWECHEIGTGSEASGECSFCHSGEKSPYQPPASDR